MKNFNFIYYYAYYLKFATYNRAIGSESDNTNFMFKNQ